MSRTYPHLGITLVGEPAAARALADQVRDNGRNIRDNTLPIMSSLDADLGGPTRERATFAAMKLIKAANEIQESLRNSGEALREWSEKIEEYHKKLDELEKRYIAARDAFNQLNSRATALRAAAADGDAAAIIDLEQLEGQLTAAKATLKGIKEVAAPNALAEYEETPPRLRLPC